MQENQMRHILVVTPLVGFGDGVQMIPFFQALHGAFPDRQVTWVVGFNRDFTCHLKTLCPFIHRIIHLQFKSPRFSMLWKFDLARYGLTDVAYEYIFDFHYKWPVSLLLKHRLQHQHFISISLNFLFSDVKPQYKFQRDKSYRKRVNSVWLALNLLSRVTGGFYTIDYQLPISDASRKVAQDYLSASKHYLGFVPCANLDFKLWPIERYLSVAKYFLRKGYTPVFFLGPREMALEAMIRSALPEVIIPPLMNEDEVGHPYGAHFYLALGKQLDCVLTNDCGPAHLLNCAVPPMVFLFGSTPPSRYAPQRAGVKVLCAAQWGRNQIDAISVDAVIQVVSQQIEKLHL